jgi:LPS export ABC transporter protein LptC
VLFAVLVVPPRRPSIEIKNFDFVESKEQRRTVQVKATKADVFKPEDVVMLEAPRVLAWGVQPKPFEISGKTGVMNANTQDLQVRGSTLVLTPDGYEFKTENLSYEAGAKQLLSDDPVEARPVPNKRSSSQLRLNGTGLRISLDRGLYEILRSVKAEQKLSASSSLTVRSRRAEIAPESHQASFHRDVSVKSSKIDMRGEILVIHFEDSRPRLLSIESGAPAARIQANLEGLKIRSKGLEVSFDSEGEVKGMQAIGDVDAYAEDGTRLKAQKLFSDQFQGRQRLRLEGQVTIETGTRLANCEEAFFFPSTGDIQLDRVATVRSGDQVLEGERIRFSTRNSEVRVEGARGQVGRKQLGLR